MTRPVLLGQVVCINPPVSLKKGSISKFVSMDKVNPFRRKIGGYEEREYKGGSKFLNGDTLLARITPCLENGKTAYVDILEDGEIGAGSTEFIVLRSIDGVTNSDYLYYLSISPDFRSYAIQAMIGTSGRQRVQNDVLARYEFELPLLEVQQRIGEQLRTIDEKIELNLQMNGTLEQIGQALFRHHFATNPESKKWRKGRLGQLVDINMQSVDKDYSFDEIQYVDISSVSSGSIDSMEFMSLTSAPSRARRIVRTGDIIWATVRPNRRAYALIMDPPANLIVSTGFAVITPKPNATGYAYFHTSSREFADYLTLHAKGAAYPAVNASDFENEPILIPDETTLKNFNVLVVPIMEKIGTLKKEIQTLSTLRDTLLPPLISGKIEVK